MRTLVDTREGTIRTRDLPLLDWPDKLFAQDWSLPAMSALVSRTPGHAYCWPTRTTSATRRSIRLAGRCRV